MSWYPSGPERAAPESDIGKGAGKGQVLVAEVVEGDRIGDVPPDIALAPLEPVGITSVEVVK